MYYYSDGVNNGGGGGGAGVGGSGTDDVDDGGGRGYIYLSIHRLQRLHRWSLRIDE